MPQDRSSFFRGDANRRQVLAMGGALAAGAAGASWAAHTRRRDAAVFVAAGQRYDGPLVQTIREGLAACGIGPALCRGKRVLLKPNLVEPTRAIPHMTTHPAVIVAAAEAFRSWGADVRVGEAPGHVRDTAGALVESGVGEALAAARLPFADLNYQASAWRRNRLRCSSLDGIYLPQDVLEADLLVSLPKLKTHHWVGMTCSLKNLYGILPGLRYGWPKNVLHHRGIPQTVVDINGVAPRTIAIVDAIDCMEGDGPILGSCKALGALLIGGNPTAVDATAARLMGLVPERINYLQLAAGRLGPVVGRQIEQRGDRWESIAARFALLDEPHLAPLKALSDDELQT
jgi:uncharacterized protein (DUF362 family)